jgi:hypothetical protein
MGKVLALLLFLFSGAAIAQSGAPIKQYGSVTVGHMPYWITNGVVGDSGIATNGSLSAVGVTASGPGICQNSGSIHGPYNELCFNVTSSGGQLTFNNFGGASGELSANINGTTYPFPFSLSGTGVVGPSSTTADNLMCWNNTTGTLAADCSTLVIGGGTALTLPSGQPISGAWQFIPSAAVTTGIPVVAIEKLSNYANDVTINPTLYIGTQAEFSTAGAFDNALISEVAVTSNSVSSGSRPYANAAYLVCQINSGITNSTTCEGLTSSAVAQSPFGAIIGVEGAVFQNQANAVAPSDWGSSLPTSISFMSTNGGTDIASAGFAVNPYNGNIQFQVGFWCPPDGSGGTEIASSCFNGAAHADYGLDLSLGTWSTDAIVTPGFQVLPTGNVAIGPTTGTASIYINNVDTTHNAEVYFVSNGTTKWEVGKGGTNGFFIYDDANSVNAISIASGVIQFGESASWTATSTNASTTGNVYISGHTAIAEWLTVVDSSGTTRYVPAY